MDASQTSETTPRSDEAAQEPGERDTQILINAWFDVRCPWCYVGTGRLKTGIELFRETNPEVPVTVIHHSYQLAPDMPDRFAGDEADYMSRYEGQPVERARAWLPKMRELAASEGLDLRFDELHQVNTRPAHRLFQLAKHMGDAEPLVDQLFRAYFTECLDLADADVLADIAERVGIDRDQALAAVSDEEYDGAIRSDHVRAEMLGANGVPFFLINAKYSIPGAREAKVIAEALREVVRRETGEQTKTTHAE